MKPNKIKTLIVSSFRKLVGAKNEET